MAATTQQPMLSARSNTMPLGTPSSVHRSPLLGQRSPMQGKRTTLGDLGAFLPRPSPRLSTRTLPRTGVKQALGTRGGVVRNQDGFEVFYGVSKAAPSAKPKKTKAPERDGFDIFFGIQSSREQTNTEKEAPMIASARAHASGSAPEVNQQVESQLQARLARPVPSPHQTSRFVPIGRSMSDSLTLHTACGFNDEPAVSTMVQADVSRITAVREEEEECGKPVECVNLGDGPSAPPAPSSSQPATTSSQAQLVKGFEVFSMSGRPTPGYVPAGVVAFDLATPTPSFEPSAAPKLAVTNA